MHKYIHPLTDFGFKKLFGNASSSESLISLLNEVLRPDGEVITGITFLNAEQPGHSPEDRASVFDLYCQTADGRRIIVEVQRQHHPNFAHRMLYYSAWPLHQQGKKGGWDFQLKAVYVIALMDFRLNPDDPDPRVISRVRLMDTERKTQFSDRLTFVYLELPNFKKTADELETDFDKWLFLLTRLDRLTSIPKTVQERVFMKFLSEVEVAQLSELEQNNYFFSLNRYRTDVSIEEHRKREAKEHRQQVKEHKQQVKEHKRREKELQRQAHKLQQELAERQRAFDGALMTTKTEATAEGKAEGELNAKMQFARSLYAKGFSTDMVMELTGLSSEQLQHARQKL